MKWNKLPDKEPNFERPLILWLENDSWTDGMLREIRSNGDGKNYVFLDSNGGQIPLNVTHWAIPTKPKE